MNTIKNRKNRLEESLLIRLPVDFEDHPSSAIVEWIYCEEEHDIAQKTWQSSSLDRLPERSDSCHTTLLVPNEWLLLTEVELPSHLASKPSKHLSQTLSFLVEEQIASDIEALHLALGSRNNGKNTIAAIERKRLRELVHLLESSQVFPSALVPEGLTLPLHEESVSLLLEPCRVTLRSSYAQSFSTNTTNIQFLLDSWQPPSNVSQITIFATDEHLVEDHRLGLEAIATTHNVNLQPALSEAYSIDPDHQNWQNSLNLLQGEFSPAKKKSASRTDIRVPMIAAASLFVLYVSYLIISGFYFESQSNRNYELAENLYRSYFPDDRRIVNIRAQTNNHLSKPNQATGSFTDLLARVIVQWQPNAETLRIQQIRYTDKQSEMVIELYSKSIDGLDDLRQKLVADNLKTELLSAIEEDEGIRGRLKIVNNAGGKI